MTWGDVSPGMLAQADQELEAMRVRLESAVDGYVGVLDQFDGDSVKAFASFLLPMVGATALAGPSTAASLNMALLMLAERKRADRHAKEE